MTFRTLNEADRDSADTSNRTLRFNRTQQDAGWSDHLDEDKEPSPIAVLLGAILLGAPALGAFLILVLSGG